MPGKPSTRQDEDRKAAEFLQLNVPPEFQTFSGELYPCPKAISSLLAMPQTSSVDDDGIELPGYRGGLLLHGPSGSGKTRAAFAYLTQRIKADPSWRFHYSSAPALKRRLTDAARAGRAQAVIDEFTSDSFTITVIDDLSQAQFTASFAENLFELIDRIYRERLELIVTVQCSGEDLVRKWCAYDSSLVDQAQAIARRLRDYCTPIMFTRLTR